MKSFDKRIDFIKRLLNDGVDSLKANSWYCNLPKSKRDKTDNNLLIAEFKEWSSF